MVTSRSSSGSSNLAIGDPRGAGRSDGRASDNRFGPGTDRVEIAGKSFLLITSCDVIC